MLTATTLTALLTTGLLTATGLPSSAATGPVTGTAPPGRASAPVDPEQTALREARATGRSVPVPALTTASSTLTVNPDGSRTLVESAVPVRKRVGGTWRSLDATLTRGSTGTLRTTTTTDPLTLSGGGTGPLATLTHGTYTLALTAPVALPAPVLAGPTATYREVLPGVDLQATATPQGGLSTVLIVRTPAAAANPKLADWTFATRTSGLTLSTDPVGNIAAVDHRHRTVFTAPAPTMWDSATTSTAAKAAPGTPTATTGAASTSRVGSARLAGGPQVDAHSGVPLTSTAAGPGIAAHHRRLAVATDRKGIHLRPDRALLTNPGTTYPVYIDPSYAASKMSGWATINSAWAGTSYWNSSPATDGRMQVGYLNDSINPIMTARTLLNFPIPSGFTTGTKIAATLNLYETHAYSCSPTTVEVYGPAATLTSGNATWNAWKGVGLGARLDAQTVAHGYSSACPQANVGFNVTNAITAAVSAGRTTQTLVLKAQNEADTYSWKKFQPTATGSVVAPYVAITYNNPPNAPSNLTTSPLTSCSSVKTIGDGPVTLYATLSDPDGTASNLTGTFHVTNATTGKSFAVDQKAAVASGSPIQDDLSQTNLEASAAGALTTFSWYVTVTDGVSVNGSTPATVSSPTCSFKFDPTRPGAPQFTPPATGASTVGQPAVITITPPATPAGAAVSYPASYVYQLNSAAPGTVAANADGTATLTVTPTRLTNVLAIFAVSAGGNYGEAVNKSWVADPPAASTPGDLNGDGAADLLSAGGTDGLPAGLWLAGGRSNGQLFPNATDIGERGVGNNRSNSPADFDGAQVITGHFSTSMVQDVFALYPNGYTTGTNQGSWKGGGFVLPGNGDGTTLQTQRGTTVAVDPALLSDDSGNTPTQAVDAGTTLPTASTSPVLDDLLTVNGDVTASYLTYYPGPGTAGGYGAESYILANKTPTGGSDWINWQLAGTQTGGKTQLFLYNRGAGALYLWKDLTASRTTDPVTGANTVTLTATPYTLAAGGWNTNANLTLHATDLNGDGNPDLTVTVGSTAPDGTPVSTATSYLVTALNATTATGTVDPQPSQTLTTAAHAWTLADMPAQGDGKTVDAAGSAPAHDNIAGLDLSATGTGATWNTGDTFDPDVELDGTSALATTGPAVSTNGSFSVAAWVKPMSSGGIVLSQDGTNTSGFMLYLDTKIGWTFALANADQPTGWSYDYIGSNTTPPVGMWAKLLATFDASSGLMKLYVNNVLVAQRTHTARIDSRGAFTVGRYLNAQKNQYYFKGQVAQVQAWRTVVGPAASTYYQSFYSSSAGIGGYDLTNAGDQVIPFDYEHSGKLDHLMLYRPGAGTVFIVKHNADGTFSQVYATKAGIGSYDMLSTTDRAIPFDYDHSGKLDYLMLYRPGTGIAYIVKHNPDNTFSAVYSGRGGIGGYDLTSTADQAIPFDYDGTGNQDYLVLYRPGTGIVFIVKHNAGATFTPVYATKAGIGGYNVANTADRILPFDHSHRGTTDYLFLYRPGTGIAWVVGPSQPG